MVRIEVEIMTGTAASPTFETTVSRVPCVGECLYDEDRCFRVEWVSLLMNANRDDSVAIIHVKAV